VTHDPGDVRQVIERLESLASALRRADVECEGYVPPFDDWAAECASLAEALTSQPAPSGWQQRIAAERRERLIAALRERDDHEEVLLLPLDDEEDPPSLLVGEIRVLLEGQNAVDALPPAPEVKA
jgi:hypothetical protein